MRKAGPEVRALDAAFGAEVVGADPAYPLDAEAHASIRRALHKHRILLFRGEPRPPSPHASAR